MVPFYILQFAADAILCALGVDPENALDVLAYSRMMILANVVNLVNMHLETTLNNFGYVKCTMGASIVAGLAVDMFLNYLFVLRLDLGIQGCAMARICVQVAVLMMYVSMLRCSDLHRSILPAPQQESSSNDDGVFKGRELREYMNLGVNTMLSNLSGWLVFELQMLGVANIHNVSQGALAAGALWIQFETSLAAMQIGWISAITMRSLSLLGSQDPGARKGFWLLFNVASFAVAAINVLLISMQGVLTNVVSNNESARQSFSKILWILVVHTQTRIWSLTTAIFYVPLGQGYLQIALLFVTFYCISAPVAGVIALSDAVTAAETIKLGTCVGLTSLAQGLQMGVNIAYLCRLDWAAAGLIVNRRANTDRLALSEEGPSSCGHPPRSPLRSSAPDRGGDGRDALLDAAAAS